ncbi:MAG: hypothetical protein JSS35_09430 [Proteobacteria bacterium]|nr:hypothetical protein [Pseudomonadota bacterium]
MILAAARGADGRPALGRALGARRGAGARLDTFVSRAQWPRLLEAIGPGDPVAVTFSRVQDYRTYQVKGRLVALRAAEPDDLEFIERYQHAVGRLMASVGVPQAFVARWLIRQDMAVLSLDTDAVFVQTPGPGAGRPLGERAP